VVRDGGDLALIALSGLCFPYAWFELKRIEA
jgi:hypothetical protein